LEWKGPGERKENKGKTEITRPLGTGEREGDEV